MFDGWTKIFQANEAWAFDGYAEATGTTPSGETPKPTTSICWRKGAS